MASYRGRPQKHNQKGGAEMAEAERKVSVAQRKATDKYLEKFDEMRVRVPIGRKADYQAHAKAKGESLNSFIIRAMDEAIERDNNELK